MIIVGIGKAFHDCSICVNINGDVKYAKWERELQQKHAKAPEWWFWKKLSEWNVPFDQIDLIVETDGGVIANSDPTNIQRHPFGGIERVEKHQKHIVLDHHLAHIWSLQSFSKECSGIVIDGRGSGGYSMMLYSGGKISRSDVATPGSVFTAMGRQLKLAKYIQDNAGKIMGLIPYGNVNDGVYNVLKKYIPNNFREMLQVISVGAEIPPDESSCSGEYKSRLDMMATVNEVCYGYIQHFFSLFNKKNPIYYSGGVALNVDWNRRLIDEGYTVIVEPASYDGGLSIGCMRYACDVLGVEQPVIKNFPYIQDDEAPDSIPTQETIQKVAKLLADGKIVGWYQGHGELGPRALGNRSILMNPTVKNGKDILNSKVKHREWFRPFGASVKKDKASKYFDLDENPYMLFTANVLDKNLPAITHVDGTCRHQTVTVESNKLFYSLLDEFDSLTGLPVLLNTSLNLGGKPIAGKIEDAIELFNTTEMDALCVGNTLYIK